MYIYLNDQIISDDTPLISHQDRGFLLADGLFETFKIIDRTAVYLSEHLDRLFHGANILGISHSITFEKISKAILDLIEKNKLDGTVLSARLTLTRGVGPRGLLPPDPISPTVLLTISPYVAAPDRPYTLWVALNRRNEFSVLSNIKSLAYTDNVLGRIEAEKNGADDVLFLNTKGFVACTSCANIFIVKNNILITPSISDGVLPGITRQKVIQESTMPVQERSITLDECRDADEVFITNSLLGMRKIALIIS